MKEQLQFRTHHDNRYANRPPLEYTRIIPVAVLHGFSSWIYFVSSHTEYMWNTKIILISSNKIPTL